VPVEAVTMALGSTSRAQMFYFFVLDAGELRRLSDFTDTRDPFRV
jgi:hypothetical protein